VAALVLTTEQRAMLSADYEIAYPARGWSGKGNVGLRDVRPSPSCSALLVLVSATIYRCLDKALAAGVQMGLKDKYHR
jgi:hypothetical protein